MPEANVLYSVTAVVVAGLVAWVAVVLKTAKEPWTREPVAAPPRARGEDVPVEKEAEAEADADADAKADSDAKVKVDDAKTDEAKTDEAKVEDAKADDAKKS